METDKTNPINFCRQENQHPNGAERKLHEIHAKADNTIIYIDVVNYMPLAGSTVCYCGGFESYNTDEFFVINTVNGNTNIKYTILA